MSKFKDFDRMISEMKHETIPFKIFGKEYQIKKQIPATIVLELSSYDDDTAVPSRMIFKAGRAIFGDAVLDELCSHPDFSADVLVSMIQWAFAAINETDNNDDMKEVTEDDLGVIERKN